MKWKPSPLSTTLTLFTSQRFIRILGCSMWGFFFWFCSYIIQLYKNSKISDVSFKIAYTSQTLAAIIIIVLNAI